MSLKLYVKAASKKEINEKLAAKKPVYGNDYSMFDNQGTIELNETLPNGTVITVYDKFSGGNPVGKAYGTWNAKKNKVM